jgi:hypothetical protein
MQQMQHAFGYKGAYATMAACNREHHFSCAHCLLRSVHGDCNVFRVCYVPALHSDDS